jgi:hypothetical protein
MIANQCDHPAGNTLSNIMPSVANGSRVVKWNNQTQMWEPISYFFGGQWTTNYVLNPGEGAFFWNPGVPFNLTISGNPHTPVLPLNLPPNGCCIVSRQEPLVGGFTDITGLAPAEGDTVWQFESPPGFYLQDSFMDGAWEGDSGGMEPMAAVGESVWICRGGGSPNAPPPCEFATIDGQPSNANILICCSNVTYCGGFSVIPGGSPPFSYQWMLNGTPIAGATNSSYGFCPVTLADNGKQFSVWITNDCGAVTSQVATLSVTEGSDTTPPVLTCPTNITVQCEAYIPPPNTGVIIVSEECDRRPTVVHDGDVVTNTFPKTIVRTYKATDACGNVGTCTQIITVLDTMPPVFVCSAPLTNLVANPGFENVTGCPLHSQIHLAPPWYSPTSATPDLFHACSPQPPFPVSVGVPTNFFGNQTPYGGQAYGGGFMFGSDYREYLATPLSAPLIAGQTYEVSFHVSLAESSGYAIDRMGAYFTGGQFLFGPQVQNPLNNFLADTNNWMLVQGTFTATGGQDQLLIGNFSNDTNTARITAGGSGPHAYYYVDDVTVKQICASLLTNKTVPCGSAWSFDVPLVLDACCGTNVTLTILSTVTNGTCPRTITRTWRATDCASNSATWSQSITLVDTIPPVMTCPTNLTVTAAPGQGGAVVSFTVSATDGCDGAVPVSCSAPAGFFAVGTTVVTCTAVDSCHNTNGCTFSVTVIQPERIGFCSFTQGFYGNANGRFNGTPSLTVIGNLLSQGPLIVGKTNSRSLTILPGNAALLQSRLPSGGPAVTLPNNGNQVLPTAVVPLNGNGRFNNVLLGQTITLSLNVRLSPQLLNFGLAPKFCTQAVLPGPDGLRGTGDDVLVNGSILMFSISNSVLNALTNLSLGITNSTVQGLLELANRGLAAQPTGGASLADINAAVDAINRGFDECRVLVDCTTGMVIVDSFNNNFTNSPPLGGGGGGWAARWLNAVRGGDPVAMPQNIRVTVPNLEATKEPGEPDHAGNAGGKSLWWRWLAPRSGRVLLQTTGTSFDSLLAVYTGTDLSNLVLVASNDDPIEGGALAEVIVEAQAGTEYHIAVDGFDGQSGTIVLSLITERPRLCLPLVRTGNQVRLCVNGEPGQTYTIEASRDLTNWTPLASVSYTEEGLLFIDPEAAKATQRFYRVSLDF